mmetsp:Transcript_3381/g.8039  ORF Transcript_3381/g.8039 Transcript_3381/m.8039 type:complete len:589 (+) Transcript_3381:123-1889(+)
MALGQSSPRRAGLRQMAARGFFTLLLLGCLGFGSAQTNPPGLGEWEVSFFTTKAEGIGCGFDWLDVQVDDEIITGLVINKVEGSDCSPGSTGCQYELNWKCAVYDTFDDSPEKQVAPATISADGKQATIVVPPYTSQLFTGKQTMKIQTIIATESSVSGSEAWSWTSTDDQAYVCEGEDRISALKQVFPCEPDWYDDDFGYPGEEFPEGPVPEGQWQIDQETLTADGALCDELGLEVGMKTSSSIIISPGYADDGSLSDTKYDVYFKCSSDDALIDQIDEAELQYKDGGKMVLTIKRKETMEYNEEGEEDFYEYDEEALTEEEQAELQAIANVYGAGPGAFSEGEEMDYTIVFCPDEKAPRKYSICEGTGNWHWWIQSDSCKGTEKFTGREGNCTDQMMGVDDWYSEWDEDDWYGGSEDYEDWWQDDYDEYGSEGEYGEEGEGEEDQSWWDYLWGGDYEDEEGAGGEEPEIKREEEGRVDLSDPSMANKPFWEHADLDPAHGPIAAPKRDEDGNSAPRPKKPVISAWGNEELSKDGYPVRHYRSARSRMGFLFVGVPLLSLALGIGYIGYKRYRARGGAGPAYSRVSR